MFHVRSFEAKNKLLEFDFQYMNSFESFGRSDNDVHVYSMFNKTVLNPSLKVTTPTQILAYLHAV